MLADLAAGLRAEARRADERRLLVLAGGRERARDALEPVVAGADLSLDRTTVVGPDDLLSCERVDPARADLLLGTTREAVVLDGHAELRPNALGRAVGAVDGGGLLVLLAPPLDVWPDRRDAFDETLAVPPFDVADVSGNFRTRLVETLRTHPGIAIVDVDESRVLRDGRTDPPPRRRSEPPTPPADHAFPDAAYHACLTRDQAAALQAFEALHEPGHAVVAEADRGRGKSSAAGLAAGSLAMDGYDVLVTAPQYRSAREVFARAEALLDDAGALAATDRPDEPHRLETGGGVVRFAPPPEAAESAAEPDVVFVDEAAALPVRLLESFLAAPAVAFTTTVHGYEGAGRGFAVRFRARLAESEFEVTDVGLQDPIRYAPEDPVEVWAFRALLVDARPPVEPLVEDATPESVTYERLSAADLLADEHLLREAFGLLVLAHYRTEPDDLARLLDAPNVAVRALCHDGHVASVALLAREGALHGDVREHMYEGGRVRGNMLPDVLTSQLRDPEAGVPAGMRVMRIATHHAARSRGLGTRLLGEIEDEFGDDLDWLGVGYGLTPDLVRFWAENGYGTVHLSTTRNRTSGEYSALMLRPLSPAGEALHDRHGAWFERRVASMLSDPIDDMAPDAVRAALRATEGAVDLDLSAWDWRLLGSAAAGVGLFDVAPRPFRRLALAHLVDPDPEALSARAERMLVMKVLQGRDWGTTADALDYEARSECMRALGRTVGVLVERFGDEVAREEADRFD